MKQLLTVFTILMLTTSIYAQKDETIFGSSGIRLTGIWGGSTSYVSGIEDDFNPYGGGFFTFELNKSVLLGWSNHETKSILNGGQTVSLKSNDFMIGYTPLSYRAFHPYFYTTVGRATAELSGEGTDRVLSIQPSASMELNVLRWFRISLDGGYRFVSGSDFANVSDKTLSGAFVGLRLKFGWSWGR